MQDRKSIAPVKFIIATAGVLSYRKVADFHVGNQEATVRKSLNRPYICVTFQIPHESHNHGGKSSPIPASTAHEFHRQDELRYGR